MHAIRREDRQLLVCQMGGSMDDGDARGSIAVFDLASEERREVYPAGLTGEVMARARVERPDNLSWSRNGGCWWPPTRPSGP